MSGKSKEDKPKITAAKPCSVPSTWQSSTHLLMQAIDSPMFYIDSGASAHLIPSKDVLYNYVEFKQPLKIVAANNRKRLAYGSGTTHVATSVNGVGHEADLEDIPHT